MTFRSFSRDNATPDNLRRIVEVRDGVVYWRHRTDTMFANAGMRDRHLVRQLRAGRRLWPETEAKIRDFMASYPDTRPKASAA